MIKRLIKKVLRTMVYSLPLRNHIIFESAPVYADNTRAVYDEMVRRGLHKKYKFFWVISPTIQKPDQIEHAKFLAYPCNNKWQYWRTWYYLHTAKALISCNLVLTTGRKGQYAICLMHGAPLKRVGHYYRLPHGLDDILSFSKYLMPYESLENKEDLRLFVSTGFPRNDVLLTKAMDSHSLFPNEQYDKLIYWMPTFRQHKTGSLNVSSVAMPILYDEQIAERINQQAKESGVLVIIKPHFAQDVSRLKIMTLSNLRFIDDGFLNKKGITNYQLLSCADALLTDYSSVYYDYLLTDRPIGLCWDDYKEFEQREGFVVDMDVVMAAGEKIYTPDDLCGFIDRLGRNEDLLAKQRSEVREMIHDNLDGKATQRAVDLIEKRLMEKR